jgi:hypothetical protein
LPAIGGTFRQNGGKTAVLPSQHPLLIQSPLKALKRENILFLLVKNIRRYVLIQ